MVKFQVAADNPVACRCRDCGVWLFQGGTAWHLKARGVLEGDFLSNRIIETGEKGADIKRMEKSVQATGIK